LPAALAVADLSRNGLPDLVVTNYGFVNGSYGFNVILDPGIAMRSVAAVALASRSGAARPTSDDSQVIAFSAPNPFRPGMHLRLGLPGRARVELAVFDVSGRRVADLLDTDLSAGEHTLTWDGRGNHGTLLGAGVYWARLIAGSDQVVRRFALLR
jgi:hypothetical protein